LLKKYIDEKFSFNQEYMRISFVYVRIKCIHCIKLLIIFYFLQIRFFYNKFPCKNIFCSHCIYLRKNWPRVQSACVCEIVCLSDAQRRDLCTYSYMSQLYIPQYSVFIDHRSSSPRSQKSSMPCGGTDSDERLIRKIKKLIPKLDRKRFSFF